MSRHHHLLTLFLAMAIAFFVSGCKSDSEEPDSNPTVDKFKGTTWHYYKKVEHLAHKDEVLDRDAYWTFLSDSFDKASYKMLIKGIDSTSLNWFLSNDSQSQQDKLWIMNSSYPNPEGLSQAICCNGHDILKLTDTELILGSSTHEIYLRKVPYDEFTSGNGSGGNPPVQNILQTIKDNIETSATYKDYIFTFTIESKVKKALPNATVKYGIGHLSTEDQDEVNVSVGNDAYSYSSYKDGDTEIVTIRNPFWFYYLFVDRDDNKSAECEIYYNTFSRLQQQGYSNLSKDEQNLYNSVKGYLDDYQDEVKSFYRPAIYVIVNGKFYRIATYKLK